MVLKWLRESCCMLVETDCGWVEGVHMGLWKATYG